LGQILKEYLEIKGFITILCRDGKSGLQAFNKGKYDLCIFDVMMPIMDGFTVAEEIRKTDKQTPIIFLTAKAMKEDAIKGLKIGADDYLTKPFSMEELRLRIGAILRRTKVSLENQQPPELKSYTIGHFTFESDVQVLKGNAEEYKLTSKESELLAMLCQHKNQTLERSIALKKIWFDDNYFNSRSMDVYITKLRKYLKSDERLQIINVHGTGFKLIESV
jgi:DNA-binding response OmpR family regulator